MTHRPPRTRRIWLAVAAASLAIGSVPHAQARASFDPSAFAALRWRQFGPNRGRRSIAVAAPVSRPHEAYFGAVSGGLWKTTDGRTTWNPVTDGHIKSSSVGAVAVSESNPDVVYIGMGESCIRGNIMQGDGRLQIDRCRQDVERRVQQVVGPDDLAHSHSSQQS